MPAKWHRVSPAIQVGQIQAVASKKHVTIFMRSSSAPNAGSKVQKDKFTACAAKTRGERDRKKRTDIMRACLRPA